MDDAALMRRALALAERGWARTRPNPMVGALVVRDDEIVGTGWHAEYGGPHAEVVALAEAGERARGATLYVTLEPCSHHGRTPPCTDAVLRAGVARVVIAARDPNPIAGGGAARLRSAGIEVVEDVARDEARALNAEFFHVHERRTVFVALKLAVSLDGMLSARAGEPAQVTGAQAAADVHRLRAGFDAILIGAGTARADDPLLTVRGELKPASPPARVIVDTRAALALDSRLVRGIDEAAVQVFCSERAPEDAVERLRDKGVQVALVPEHAGRVDLGAALDALWSQGMRAVLCEGGSALAGALLGLGRVNRLVLYVAPRFFGPGGAPAFRLADRPVQPAWRLRSLDRLGEDVRLVYDPVEG
jgi:diaminohydroxyphosphoribosylaminopyrimidine deaminase/5-amino-6-(5-phosphoribosylamino)uracil reductase